MKAESLSQKSVALDRIKPTELRMIKAGEKVLESSHCSGGVCQMNWKPPARKNEAGEEQKK